MQKTLYFDSNATTAVDPRVLEAMLPFFTEKFGNSMSALHSFGWTAESALEESRQTVAQFLGARPEEITFTSGATESNNAAILGLVHRCHRNQEKIHLLSSPIEHSSVVQTLRYVADQGWADVEWLPITEVGTIDPVILKQRLRPETRLVCAMWVQNEVGSINPMSEIASICRENKVLLLSDATQAVGKVPLNLEAVPVDLLSLSAHKFYGPKGVGLLYHRRVNPSVELDPLIHGGGHERGWRSGTVNVAGIKGMAKAIELVAAEFESESQRVRKLRDQLWQGLESLDVGARLNGPALVDRSSHNLNVSFTKGRIKEVVPGLAFSRGSACRSGITSTSPVLSALGLSEDLAGNTLRLSLSRWTTSEEVAQAIEIINRNIVRPEGRFDSSRELK